MISTEIPRNNFVNDNNQTQDLSRPIIVANSTANGIGGQQGKNLKTGENISSSSNSTSFGGLSNLNYNPELPYQTQPVFVLVYCNVFFLLIYFHNQIISRENHKV
jgi:hypothetical protein